MCKKCLSMHVDNYDPSTFLWILQDMDVPYVQAEWNTLRDRAFAKNPTKMNGMSVLGKYLSKMRLKRWKDLTWADTDRLKEELQQQKKQAQIALETANQNYQTELREKFAKGQITESQYKTLMPADVQHEEYIPATPQQVYAESNDLYNQDNFMSQDELPDPAKELTQDDKIYLAMKWGRLYKPNEWVALEQDYKNMTNSFDIQDTDTKNSLILICKLNLKANQALDSGDYEGFTKLSRELSSQRKLANFAAAGRKKEDKTDFVDSVGQLVAYCEKTGGKIPEMKITAPKDVVDTIIQDQKDYLKSLVYGDTALAKEIEDYLKNKEIQAQQKRDKKAAQDQGLDAVPLTDQDMEKYKKFIENGADEDNKTIEKEISDA